MLSILFAKIFAKVVDDVGGICSSVAVDLTERVKKLKVGRSFTVENETQRKEVLRIAKILGLRLITRAASDGKFSVTRLHPL